MKRHSYRSTKTAALFLCVVFLSCFLFSDIFAQQSEERPFVSDEYVLDQWDVEDGLPVNSVQDILQSRDGYLWLATHDGLVRFDGIDFKVYTVIDYPELKSNRIHYIEEALDGSILIKTQGVHISRLKDDTISHLMSLDITISGNGSSAGFFRDKNETIWVGGDDGLYLYQNESFERAFEELVNFHVFKIEYVSEEEVWFSSEREMGMFRIKENTVTKILNRFPNTWGFDFDVYKDEFWISAQEGLFRFSEEQLEPMFEDLDLSLAGVKVYSDSEIYVADHLKGYLKISNGKSTPLPYLYDNFYELAHSKEINNSLWSITSKGIYSSGAAIFENPDANLSTFEVDSENNIWIGTNDNGLLRLRKKLFKTYAREDGLPGKAIYPVMQSRDSTIWVGTFGQGLAGIKNGTIESGYYPDPENNTDYMQSFIETKEGDFWVSSLNFGLQELDVNEKKLRFIDDAPIGVVYSLFQDSKERIWAGFDPYTSKGLVRFTDGKWEQLSGKEHVPLALVRTILETPDGEMWFATLVNGLIRYDGSDYYQYDISDGLASNTVRGLHVTEEEEGLVLWVGFEDMGLDRIPLIDGTPDFDSSTNYQIKDGLFDNSVHIIIEDQNERFWINSNRGIFRVDRSDLNAFHREEIESLSSHGYTERDGLLSREGNGGVYPSGVQAFNGYIWFPTQDGVVSFHPDSIVSNDFIPPIKIQEIQLGDGEPTPLDSEITLGAGKRDLEISYASLSFADPKKNQYRYILEGYDDTWKSVGTRRTAYYTNLPSGTYTFRVQGSNNEGTWNTEGASLTLTVTPYFYETIPFYFLLAIIATGVFFLAVQLRSQYFKRRATILKTEVAVRTSELEKEKAKTEEQAKQLQELDEMKSKFFTDITHELRTPLTLIMGPLEQLFWEGRDPWNKEGNEQRDLMLRNSKKLLRLIDQLLDVTKLENNTVPINPERVLINSFFKKSLSLFSDAIERKEIRFSFTSTILTNQLYVDQEKLEKIIVNLMSNALKFTPLGGEISVSLEETDTSIVMIFKDSGPGIPEEEQANIFNRFYRSNRTIQQGFGIGLSITKQLVDLHKGTIEVASTDGQGSTFTVSLLKGSAHFDDLKIGSKKMGSESSSLYSTSIPNDLIHDEEDSSLPLNDQQDKTTLLIVEDNPDMRWFMRSILSGDYQIIDAKHGVQALEIIKTTPPDLIIADVMMPQMDGMELNRLLKEDPLTSSIPFVFLTAKADTESRISGIREGADFYLTKPFDSNELKAVVKNLLVNRTRLKERLLEEFDGHQTTIREVKVEQDPFLQKLHEILEVEYSNHELSVDKIQEQLFMSSSSLYRKMNEKTGMSTQNYVMQFRLEKARQMLLLEDVNISEVAYACGFNSLTYFGRVFKEHSGESPSSFVKKLTSPVEGSRGS